MSSYGYGAPFGSPLDHQSSANIIIIIIIIIIIDSVLQY